MRYAYTVDADGRGLLFSNWPISFCSSFRANALLHTWFICKKMEFSVFLKVKLRLTGPSKKRNGVTVLPTMMFYEGYERLQHKEIDVQDAESVLSINIGFF